MIREEILHTTSRTGTTVFYFVPNVTPDVAPELQEPAYVIFNNYNLPISYGTYSGQTFPTLLQNINNYQINVPLSSVTSNFVTGYSVTQTFNTIISTAQRATIEQRFKDNITTSITSHTQVAAGYSTYVFFQEHKIDDMYANVKLSRTYETLDTLQIYNKPINTVPQQEARTGILFGKLEAIQLVKNEDGNSIRIPLRNVPIGIFNPTDEYPAPTSFDENGDRFYMNLKENSSANIYPNSLAFSEDQNFLKSNSNFLSVPDKFKFTTITNENGEFVIYNAPLGNQTVVFEVDLFKQGLSKDEIILNNFPFPTNDNANIGEFPCYYYNQVPVDVVPAWGNTQTGYTELNITVNLDLRKWATYIFAPGTYGKEKLESTTAKNAANTLKINIKDMTVQGFPQKNVEVAQIIDDLDRDSGSEYLWYNEFSTQRSRVDYAKFGCHVLKLPGNIYDPNAFKTNNQGVPTTNKGVWLAAYQFRVFINATRCYCDTGAIKINGNQMISNFEISNAPSGIPGVKNSAKGVAPFEKPWSATYPEPYNIPPMPVQLRYNYASQRTYNSVPYILEEPAYSDGDLVGNVFDSSQELTNVGGYGVQEFDGVHFPNRIAFVATNSYMYKYERGVSWSETYANGYEPYWTGPSGTGNGPYGSFPALPGMSSVKKGEKWQRVECGYGYFMKYHDWNIIYRWPWVSDLYWQQNSDPTGTPPGVYGWYRSLSTHVANTYNLDDQNYAYAFDNFSNNNVRVDAIDIYRIVESGLGNISIPQNFVIPTSATFSYGGHDERLYNMYVVNTGAVDAKITNSFTPGTETTYAGGQYGTTSGFQFGGPGPNAPNKHYDSNIIVQNPGEPSLVYGNRETFILKPGGLFFPMHTMSDGGDQRLSTEVSFTSMSFPGNDGFDSNINKYTTCSYKFGISVGGSAINNAIDGNGNIPASGDVELTWNVTAKSQNPDTWYLNSSNTGTHDDTKPDRHGVSSWGLNDKYHSIYSLYIEDAPRPF